MTPKSLTESERATEEPEPSTLRTLVRVQLRLSSMLWSVVSNAALRSKDTSKGDLPVSEE